MKTNHIVSLCAVALLAAAAMAWGQNAQTAAKPDPRIDKLLEQNEQILKNQAEMLKNQAEILKQLEQVQTTVTQVRRRPGARPAAEKE